MIDREHVFGLRNEVGRDVRDITRKRGIIDGYVGQRESELFLGKKPRRAERVERKGGGGEREREKYGKRNRSWAEGMAKDRRKLRRK